jgi:DinB family protein
MKTPEIEQFCKEFDQIAAQAKEVTEGLNEERFNWRPQPGQWSIEECLAHLLIAGNWEVRALEDAIHHAKAHGMTGSGPFRYGPFEKLIVRKTEPPVQRKFTAPKHFRPLHEQPVTAVLPSFLHLQSQLALLAQSADGLDLARIKVPTPISRLLRLSLGMTFAQIAAHERRHLEQARQVRKMLPGDPKLRT